jgi:hypothetical protein
LEEHTTFFRSNGWNGKIESSTSLSRYVQLASWIAQNERKITESGVLESICDRKNEQSDINNSTTAFMMLAIPKHTKMWIADMPVTVEKFHEITFD